MLRFLLVLLALIAPVRAQLSFGPVPVGQPIERSEQSALSVDAAGVPDVLWVETMTGPTGRPAVLNDLTARLELADGGVWTADLGRAPPTSLDGGKLTTVEVRWSTFKRDGQPDLLGIHCFVERRADGIILLSFKLSNGALDLTSPASFPGGVFFKRLSILTNSGRLVPELVRLGESQPAEGTWVLADGQHYFPPRAQFNRRAALVPGGNRSDKDQLTASATRALNLVGLQLPTRYQKFGGAKLELPQIDRARAAAFAGARRTVLVNALQTGAIASSVSMYTTALGPFDPQGYDVPGAVSGDGIEAVPGWEQCREAALSRRLENDVTTERMPIALFDKATGIPLSKLPSPQDYRITRGWSKATTLPWTVKLFTPSNQYDDRRSPKDFNTGICPYRDRLLQYQAHDGQHLIRATRHAEAAWWLGRDWLARLDLEMIAADARYSWTLSGLPAQPQYSYYPFSLGASLNSAHAKPGNGSPALGREFGWVCNAWAIDLAAADALSPRSEKLQHGRAALDLAATVAMPTGVTQRLQKGEFWGSPDPWVNDGVPVDEAVSQWVMEGPKVAHGLVGLMRNAVPATDPLVAANRDVVVKWARSAYLNPAIQTKPSPYNASVMGIPKWGFVGKVGGPAYATVPKAMGEADPTSSWDHLALAWELTGDNAFLDAMNKLGGVVSTRSARIASFNVIDLRDLCEPLSALQRAGN